MNSQIRNSESTDSEQHNEADKEPRGGHASQGNQEKHTPEEEVGKYLSSSVLIPNQFFFLWYEEFVLNSLICVENPSHCS